MSIFMSIVGKKSSKTACLIQEMATHIFAMQGYDGTIMDELAADIGVNKASIYYHFGSKKGLYEACMTHLFSGVADKVIASVSPSHSVWKQLEALIQAFSEAISANPDISICLMREMASGGETMPVTARQQMQRLLFCLQKILKRGEREGVFRTIQPLSLHVMIVGGLSLYVNSEPLRRKIESSKMDLPVSEMTKEVVQLIQNGLRVSL